MRILATAVVGLGPGEAALVEDADGVAPALGATVVAHPPSARTLRTATTNAPGRKAVRRKLYICSMYRECAVLHSVAVGRC